MVAPSSMTTPGPMMTFGSMSTSLPILVSWLRNTVSGATSVAPSAITLLRKLGAGVDAEDFIGVARQHARVEPVGMGKRYSVREIELSFGVGIADARQ